MTAIRETTRVRADRTIAIPTPGLPPGEEVEVPRSIPLELAFGLDLPFEERGWFETALRRLAPGVG